MFVIVPVHLPFCLVPIPESVSLSVLAGLMPEEAVALHKTLSLVWVHQRIALYKSYLLLLLL